MEIDNPRKRDNTETAERSAIDIRQRRRIGPTNRPPRPLLTWAAKSPQSQSSLPHNCSPHSRLLFRSNLSGLQRYIPRVRTEIMGSMQQTQHPLGHRPADCPTTTPSPGHPAPCRSGTNLRPPSHSQS